MRIAILGGAGCIGSALSRLALALGHEVDIFDDLSGSSLLNVPSGAEFHFADLERDSPEVMADVIFNLASPIGPAYVRSIPIRTLRVNWNATLLALESGLKCGARVVHASTAEVYGDARICPTPETYRGDTSPVEPGACYIEAKRATEALCTAYRNERHVDACIVRIFNTYGPDAADSDDRAVPAFIRAALANKDITLFGDGRQTRSLCYVDDTARGLMAAAMRSHSLGPWNIGNPSQTTMRVLAEYIVELTGSKSRITTSPSQLVGPTQRSPCVAKAYADLKWKPTTNLRDGLLQTIAHMKERYVAH